MHTNARARAAARRRLVGLATAVVLAGATASAATATAAMARSTARPTAKARPVPPRPLPRTGLIASVCKLSHRSNDDPIVHPNDPGVSHSHDFFGNVTTDASSTPASLGGHATTCGVAGDTAAYWAPTLYVDGAPRRPAAMFAYYSVFGNQHFASLPIGLEMVAKGAGHVFFSCYRHSMPTAAYTHMPTCRPGDQMAIGVNFPSCWDGTDLDSADHMSHMAYAVHNVCPHGYPVVIPRLGLWITYKAAPRGSVITLSSGGLDTAHADYINAWNRQTLSTLERLLPHGTPHVLQGDGPGVAEAPLEAQPRRHDGHRGAAGLKPLPSMASMRDHTYASTGFSSPATPG